MPEYTLEACTREGELIDEFPDAVLTSVSWTLSGIGNLDFNLMQDDERVTVPELAKNEIRLFIEDWPDPLEVPWQGVCWQDSEDPNRVQFNCGSLESYLERRFIDFASLYWADGNNNDIPVEQLNIGWDLMQYAQGRLAPLNPDKELHIDAAAFAASGKQRLRRYERNDHANILSLLGEFPNLVDFATGVPNGFDWMIRAMRDGARLWTPFYPQRGQLRADLALEYGRNISSFKVNTSATNLTTRTICTGGNTGDIKIEANYKDEDASALPPDGFGEMLSIISDGNQKDPNELKSKARSHVAVRNRPVSLPDLQAIRVPVELLGVLVPGDTVPVSIHRGRTQIEDTYRIKTITWKVRPNTLQLEFIPKVA